MRGMVEATPRRQQDARGDRDEARVGRNVGPMLPGAQAQRVRHEIGRRVEFLQRRADDLGDGDADSGAQAQERRDVDRHRVAWARGHRAFRITSAYRAGDPRSQGRGAYAFSDVNETDGRDSDGHEGCPSCRAQELRAEPPHRLNRRSALRLAAGAGAAIAVAPHLRSGGARPVDFRAAERVVANPNWPAPAMVTRAQWGANEALARRCTGLRLRRRRS